MQNLAAKWVIAESRTMVTELHHRRASTLIVEPLRRGSRPLLVGCEVRSGKNRYMVQKRHELTGTPERSIKPGKYSDFCALVIPRTLVRHRAAHTNIVVRSGGLIPAIYYCIVVFAAIVWLGSMMRLNPRKGNKNKSQAAAKVSPRQVAPSACR